MEDSPAPQRLGHLVILGRQIWLTTATPDGHDFAVGVDAGFRQNHLQRTRVPPRRPGNLLGNNLNSYASCSPVIEPGRFMFTLALWHGVPRHQQLQSAVAAR